MKFDTFRLLAGVLGYAPGPVRAAAFGPLDDLQPLIDLGILVPKGSIAEITCTECDEGHAASIVTVDGKLIGLCDRLGCEFAIEEDVTAYEFSASSLIDWIAVALKTTDRPRLLAGCRDLWALGPIRDQGYAIAIYVVPRIADYQHLADIADAIRSRSHANRDGAALIHCGSLECSPSATPSGLVIIRLLDFAGVSGAGNCAVEIDRLFELTVPTWKLKPATRGRPAIVRDALLPIIADLDEQGHLPTGVNNAAKAAIAEFESRNPDIEEGPKLSAAKGAVKVFRTAKTAMPITALSIRPGATLKS